MFNPRLIWKKKESLFRNPLFAVQNHCSSAEALCINADWKLCLNAGQTKTHGGRFSYRRPLSTPLTDRTKSSSAVPLQFSQQPNQFTFSNPLSQQQINSNQPAHKTHHSQRRFVVYSSTNHAFSQQPPRSTQQQICHQWISGFNNTKPPATTTHDTHHRQQRFGFKIAAKAAPSSAPQ